MTDKVTKYDLASRLVQREVRCCVSQVVSALYEATQYPMDSLRLEEDDIRDLMSRPDYETPGRYHIQDLDVWDLEEVVELMNGDWEELLVEQGMPTNDMLQEAVYALDVRISDLCLEISSMEDGATLTEDQQVTLNTMTVELAKLEAERDSLPEDLDDWLKLEDGRIQKLREAVATFVDDTTNGWRTIVEREDIDPEYDGVYEHWIVSYWFGRKLEQEGEIVRNVCGLTIWGRCCTGQAIALDYVIQKIACDLWGSELTEGYDPADAL